VSGRILVHRTYKKITIIKSGLDKYLSIPPQLDMYEEERTTLESQNAAKDSDLKNLAAQYGQALGHQNHKQKIKHLVKLKEENVLIK
jgi:hyaluronan-mediated motility receptor